ncbi:proteasome component pup2 [Metarhizium acridum]|nr:proteasome component pup2 [Metarhizium acridum]
MPVWTDRQAVVELRRPSACLVLCRPTAVRHLSSVQLPAITNLTPRQPFDCAVTIHIPDDNFAPGLSLRLHLRLRLPPYPSRLSPQYPDQTPGFIAQFPTTNRRDVMARSEYDRGINTFSPEGRLFQVEYSLEAIKLGSTAIGVATSEGVISVSRRE